jgi:UTP--glucose-1-phosphate uridylyltransferase
MDIIKTVIPAAGLGTRFLPFTKAIPKEMIPVLNKPAIQYTVEEAVGSQINNIIMVTSRDKEAITNHFDVTPELESILKDRGASELLTALNKIINAATFTFIRQAEPLGLGHAIWLTRHCIDKEYFGIMLPDELIVSKTPALAQLIKIARQERASVIAVQEVPTELSSSYGMIGIKKQITPSLFQVSHLVEKPDQKEAPSNLAIIGRYVVSHKVFPALSSIEADVRGELQLTDALSAMMRNNEKIFAYKVQGTRYDIGTPIGWVKAIIGCALNDPAYAPHIRKLLLDQQQLDLFLENPSKFATPNI